MANIGGGAAYSQLQPLRNDIAQTFQQWNAIEAQKAADEAQRAHQDKLVKEKRKYDERQELKKGLELPDDAFIAKTTQFQKIDDVYFDAAEKAGERYAENEDAIMQAFDKGEMGEVKRLKNINRRLLTNMELIKEYSELGVSTYSNIIKLDNEGKVSPVGKDWVETIDAVANNNFTFEFDADGKMYSKVLKTGDDGTTRIDVYDDPRALVDGRMMPPLVVDTDQFIADWKKTAATVPIETDINPQTGKKDGNIYSGQAWTPFTEQSARASVGAITKDNKVMADLLYQFEGKDKSDKFDFTAEEYALVQDKLYGKLKAALPEVMNTKTDAAARAYNQSERHFNARMAQDSEEDKANKPLIITEVSKEESNFNTMPDKDYREFVVKKSDGKPITGVIEDAPDAQLSGLQIGKNGKVTASYYIVNNTSTVNKGDGTTTTTSAKSNTLTEKVLNKVELGKLINAGINIDELTKTESDPLGIL